MYLLSSVKTRALLQKCSLWSPVHSTNIEFLRSKAYKTCRATERSNFLVHNYNAEIILASNGMHIIRHGSQISNPNQNRLQPILSPTWFLSHYPPRCKAPTCFLQLCPFLTLVRPRRFPSPKPTDSRDFSSALLWSPLQMRNFQVAIFFGLYESSLWLL